MESAQRELVNVLLKLIFSQGLISRTTYSEAINLVYSVMDFSECLTKEARAHECTQDTQ